MKVEFSKNQNLYQQMHELANGFVTNATKLIPPTTDQKEALSGIKEQSTLDINTLKKAKAQFEQLAQSPAFKNLYNALMNGTEGQNLKASWVDFQKQVTVQKMAGPPCRPPPLSRRPAAPAAWPRPRPSAACWRCHPDRACAGRRPARVRWL